MEVVGERKWWKKGIDKKIQGAFGGCDRDEATEKDLWCVIIVE